MNSTLICDDIFEEIIKCIKSQLQTIRFLNATFQKLIYLK